MYQGRIPQTITLTINIIDQYPFPAIITDLSGNIMKSNLLFQEMIGLNSTANPALSFFDLCKHPQQSELIQTFKNLADFEKPFSSDFDIQKLSLKEIIKVHANLSAVKSDQDILILFFLHKSSDKQNKNFVFGTPTNFWEQLTESITDWITVCDRHCNIVNSNRYSMDIMQIPANECIGKKIYDYTRKLNDEINKDFFEDVISNQTFRIIDIHHYPGDKCFKLTIYPLIKENVLIGTVNSVRDITAIKKSEISLKESDKKFRILTENLPGTVYLSDIQPPWKIHYISSSIYKISGFRSDSFMSGKMFFDDITHPEDRKQVADIIKEKIEEKKPYQLEYRIIDKNNNIHFVNEQGCAIYDHSEEPSYLEGFIMDVTEEKIRGKVITDNEQLFHAVFNQQYQLTALLKVDGRLQDVNDSALEMIGWQKKDLTGMFFWDCPWWTKTRQSQRKLKNAIQQFEQKGEVKFEVINFDRNNEVRIIDFSLKAIKNDEGKIINLLAEGHDISDLRKMQMIQEKMVRKYESILHDSKLGIIISDKKGVIQEINPYLTEITGISSEEVIGRSAIKIIQKIMNPGTSRLVIVKVRELLSGESFSEFHIHFNGHILDIYSPGYIENVGIVAFVRDITELKKTEEMLIASNQKIRQLAIRNESIREEEKQSIAREIHDELGQMLTAIKMDVSWLTKYSDSEKVHERLTLLTSLTDNTLEVVRKISTELRPSILDDLGLRAAIHWYAESFSKRYEIKVKLKLNSSLIIKDKNISIALYRILQECLTNVAKHAYASQVKIYLDENRKEYIFEIIDNGIGIDLSKAQKPDKYGIAGMNERTLAFNGIFRIQRARKDGTKITVKIPKP